MLMQPVVALEIESRVKEAKSAVDAPGFLPIIPTAMPGSDSESDSSTTNVDQMRRASKRAINLLMRNMKKQ